MRYSFILIITFVVQLSVAHSEPAQLDNIEIFLRTDSYDPAHAPEAIRIQHVDIPIDKIASVINNLDPRIARELVYTKDGQKYFRWIINPQDEKYFRQLEKFCQKHGIQYVLQNHFWGYKTLSRSLVIRVDEGFYFGLKGSTSHVNGSLENKRQDWVDAQDIVAVDAALAKKSGSFDDAIPIRDSAAFGIPEINQAIVIRDFSFLVNHPDIVVATIASTQSALGKEYLQSIIGARALNTTLNFASEKLGKLQAKLLTEVGVVLDCAHGQNILVAYKFENQQWTPSRLFVRDTGDATLIVRYAAENGNQDLLDRWPKRDRSNRDFFVTSMLADLKFVSPEEQKLANSIFHESFENAWMASTGVWQTSFSPDHGGFYSASYRTPKNIMNCESILSRH